MAKVANIITKGLLIKCLFDDSDDIKTKFEDIFKFSCPSFETEVYEETNHIHFRLKVKFGSFIYDKHTQRILLYIGYMDAGCMSSHIYLEDGNLHSIHYFSNYPALIGKYLIKGIGYDDYLYYKNKKSVDALSIALQGSNISDFAICDAVVAQRFLQETTDLPFDIQDKLPKQNKNGLFHVPIKNTWKAIITDDVVPCEITVTYRYSVPSSATRKIYVKVGWNIDLKPLYVKDFILSSQ